MKKSIFLFFAAILCAMTANAQWALMGTLTDWSSGKAMTVSGSTATCDVDLTANTTYTLKVKNVNTWYGRNNTTITATTTTSAFSTSGGDVTLKSTFNGTYTFSFNTSTKKLTVTYPTEDKPVETHDITVKAKYPASWNAGKAAIHFWGNGVTGTTPAAMTKDGDWWTYTVTGVPTTSPLSVIFINGDNWNGDKNQTVDITGITENTCFEVSQSGSAKGTAVKADCETGEGEVIETHDITVKAFYPASWNAGKAAVHFWGDGVTGATPAAMTKDGDWWSYTVTGVPTTSELSVIFINGDNWNGDANQTVDITGITESTCYQITSGSGKASAAVVDCASTPVVAEDVYTVVGSDVLLGTAWDLNNADNEMTKQDDGSYVLVKENVDLATTGTYEYKVVKNHDWGWSVPQEGNLTLTGVDIDGTYNVTFTLNKELNALTPSLELVEAKKVIPECYVAGDESLTGQDWNAKSVLMTYDEATEVYTATLTAVPAGTHNMKVVYGGEWLGFDHLATPAPANVKEGDDKKIQFTLAEAGDVTVTYHATNGIGLTGNFVVPAPKYYIAGTQNLTGFDWKENGLQLTKDGDLYKHTFSALAAGIFEFKVTDGTWDNTWGFGNLGAAYEEVSEGVNGEGNPNGNIKFVTEEAKNITVIFEPAAGKITIDGLTEKTPVEKHYYLIGTFNEWALADANYELALVDGLYKKEVTLAKDAEFKVNQGNWDASWGKDNLGGKTYAELDYTDDGNLKMKEEKTFTVIFNLGENLITFEGLTENAPVAPKCYLMGNGNWENGVEMEEDGDQFKLLCQHITSAFKFKYGETWSDQVENYNDNGVDWVDGNITLPEGYYDFYYKKATNQVYIAATQSYTRGVTADNFGTICLPFGSTSYTGMELYEFVGKETGKVYLASVNALEAGVPYIFKATAAEVAVYSDGTTAATAGNSNGLYGTFADNTEVAVGNYILYGNAICEVEATCWVNANRAYIVWSEIPAGAPQQMPGRRYVSMGTQGTNATTGVDNVVVPEGQVLKVIENGQLIIIRGGEKFNVQGQKL